MYFHFLFTTVIFQFFSCPVIFSFFDANSHLLADDLIRPRLTQAANRKSPFLAIRRFRIPWSCFVCCFLRFFGARLPSFYVDFSSCPSIYCHLYSFIFRFLKLPEPNLPEEEGGLLQTRKNNGTRIERAAMMCHVAQWVLMMRPHGVMWCIHSNRIVTTRSVQRNVRSHSENDLYV